MRYWWLRDRKTQNQLKFFWEKGDNNHANYFTKDHPTIYHQKIRHKYLQDKIPKLPRTKNSTNEISIHNEKINFIGHYEF